MGVLMSPLYPILDASWLPADEAARREALQQVAEALAASGVTLLQYRNKDEVDARVLRDAAWLRQAAPASLKVVLNDRVPLVAEAGCDGAHVGQGDMSPAEARRWLGEGRILGVSTHTEAELREADASAADYVAVGPVYATSSKADAEPVVGLDGVRRARALTSKPLVAIGGITLERAREVRVAGADAVAVISGLFAPDARGEGGRAVGKLAEDFLRVLR